MRGQAQPDARGHLLLSAAGALIVLTASACGGGATASTPPPSGSPQHSALPSTAATATPQRSSPPGAPAPTLAPTSSAATRRPVRVSGHTDSALGGDDNGQINVVYSAYMTDLSGLLDYLSKDWLDAITDITTPQMAKAAAGAAAAVQMAHDHGIGTLVDSHRLITVKGTTATLTDCLDEKSWYVVENASGKPDPSVTRDFFVGTASFSKIDHQWKVSAWNSHPKRCSF